MAPLRAPWRCWLRRADSRGLRRPTSHLQRSFACSSLRAARVAARCTGHECRALALLVLVFFAMGFRRVLCRVRVGSRASLFRIVPARMAITVCAHLADPEETAAHVWSRVGAGQTERVCKTDVSIYSPIFRRQSKPTTTTTRCPRAGERWRPRLQRGCESGPGRHRLDDRAFCHERGHGRWCPPIRATGLRPAGGRSRDEARTQLRQSRLVGGGAAAATGLLQQL